MQVYRFTDWAVQRRTLEQAMRDAHALCQVQKFKGAPPDPPCCCTLDIGMCDNSRH
jgi:hypothetical protein